MFSGKQMWVPHICPLLADVGKAEGPVSNLPSPVFFFPINAAVSVIHAAACVTNTAVCVTKRPGRI